MFKYCKICDKDISPIYELGNLKSFPVRKMLLFLFLSMDWKHPQLSYECYNGRGGWVRIATAFKSLDLKLGNVFYSTEPGENIIDVIKSLVHSNFEDEIRLEYLFGTESSTVEVMMNIIESILTGKHILIIGDPVVAYYLIIGVYRMLHINTKSKDIAIIHAEYVIKSVGVSPVINDEKFDNMISNIIQRDDLISKVLHLMTVHY